MKKYTCHTLFARTGWSGRTANKQVNEVYLVKDAIRVICTKFHDEMMILTREITVTESNHSLKFETEKMEGKDFTAVQFCFAA